MFYRLFALLALVALAPARQGDAVASPAHFNLRLCLQGCSHPAGARPSEKTALALAPGPIGPIETYLKNNLDEVRKS